MHLINSSVLSSSLDSGPLLGNTYSKKVKYLGKFFLQKKSNFLFRVLGNNAFIVFSSEVTMLDISLFEKKFISCFTCRMPGPSQQSGGWRTPRWRRWRWRCWPWRWCPSAPPPSSGTPGSRHSYGKQPRCGPAADIDKYWFCLKYFINKVWDNNINNR